MSSIHPIDTLARNKRNLKKIFSGQKIIILKKNLMNPMILLFYSFNCYGLSGGPSSLRMQCATAAICSTGIGKNDSAVCLFFPKGFARTALAVHARATYSAPPAHFCGVKEEGPGRQYPLLLAVIFPGVRQS